MSNEQQNLTRGEEIEAESMRIIEAETPEPRPYQGAEWQVVRRMIHTTADFDMLNLVRFHPRAVEAGLASLLRGCQLFTDTEMARAGIPERRMNALSSSVRCLMRDPEILELARRTDVTRAHASIDFAVSRIRPEIYVIGNAPTALLRLLEHVEAGRAKPALIIGMPVGFVSAVESKALLMKQDSVPYIVVEGRKGGSALAASAINALADIAMAEKAQALKS